MSPADPVSQDLAATQRWLSIVGVGEDGVGGLSPVARGLIGDADIVFGGKRHLALAQSLIRGAVRPWPSPFERAVEEVLAQRGRPVCVLATGDPFHYGIGSVLARQIAAEEMVVAPAASAFTLAAARLGWALQETTLLSAHGRAVELVRPHLYPGQRLLVLTSDAVGPVALARLLSENGFGRSGFVVMESLGGPHERVRRTTAATFNLDSLCDLNTVAIEVIADPSARIIARSSGLSDSLFEHDGQITKSEIRAITLSALAPRRGELLWDIGAGSGSIAVEWMLADPSMRAVAIEARPDRAARTRRNAAAFGVPGLQVIEAEAPAALTGMTLADAIFVGGGASQAGVLDAAINGLRPGGRLVVNAVTLESEVVLLDRHASHGGELIRIAITRAQAVGGKTGWRPAMPVTQWRWIKP